MATNTATTLPQVGMLATVRNRRALITAVEPSQVTPAGIWHLVQVEYTDTEGELTETLIWEHEPQATLLEPTALPKVDATDCMLPIEFDALQRAARWGALSPFLPIEGLEGFQKYLYSSPFFGAVQVEEFQLFPLSRALSMSRISLLLADDVGLGKTIEAGLILTELLLRRRVRKVLVLTPAALKKQWQQEMQSKFSLTFDVIDRPETYALQKRLGLDANPWRTYPRIITSYHYLKQPDVLEQLRSTFETSKDSPHLPWDLLIVDEVHNLMPSNFGQDSDLAEMLRLISPYFEHKLFLSATPHNGHTRCFTGLLEQLDPVRFTQTHELDAKTKERIGEIVIRRLKREINQFDEQNGRHPRFCDRLIEPLPLFFDAKENRLARAFSEFRVAVKSLIAAKSKTEQLAGSFAVEVLNKRLLSCPYTFAISWQRFQEGVNQQEEAKTAEVQAARKALTADLDDDLEVEGRIQYATKTTGAWLKPLLPHLMAEVGEIDHCLRSLNLSPDPSLKLEDDRTIARIPNPTVDSRWEKLIKLIKQYLRIGQEWVENDRLIIFTEYKTTLDYLERRLQETFKDSDSRVRVLFGGMSDQEREDIKQAFNNPDDPIRILVATDAASEGLNLQETARLVLHYDIPWNPSRLDQRNGRLDRHGQSRDVIVFHFTSEDDADLRFLARVAEKVNAIREDLGSMEEVFDAAFQRRFVDFQDSDRILEHLDQAITKTKGRAEIPVDPLVSTIADLETDYEAFKQALDLSPDTLKSTLEEALGIGISRQSFKIDEQGRFHLQLPIPSRWQKIVDDYLRLNLSQDTKGALPAIVFDPKHFIDYKNQRPVFRASKDTTLLHLGHPLFHQALAMFARARFPSEEQRSSRWTARYGDVPQGLDAVLLLTVEEMAVNALREPFHHWVQTWRFGIKNGELGEQLPFISPVADRPSGNIDNPEAIASVQELWSDIQKDVRKKIAELTNQLTQNLETEIKKRYRQAKQDETERFKSRMQEVKRAMSDTSIQKLAKERDKLLLDMQQLRLFVEDARSQAEKLQSLEEELERRQKNYQHLLEFLDKEQTRVIDKVLVNRYKLRGDAQIFPVTVEIRLPK